MVAVLYAKQLNWFRIVNFSNRIELVGNVYQDLFSMEWSIWKPSKCKLYFLKRRNKCPVLVLKSSVILIADLLYVPAPFFLLPSLKAFRTFSMVIYFRVGVFSPCVPYANV